MSKVAKVKFKDYRRSIPDALDAIGAAALLPQRGLIIIKPNLTTDSPPPVTTNVEAVKAVYQYCKQHTKAEIVIGEGSGNGTTADIYQRRGYTALAKKHGIRLLDFNKEKAVRLKKKDAFVLKEFYLPEIVRDAFIISLPVLKDHSFTQTTVAMKNMFGLAPEPYYKGSWNKSKLHSPSTHKSVVDVCLYKKPDLCLVDASVALAGMHLSGTKKKIGLLLAGFDPVAVDAVGGELLGHNPRKIQYLKLADGLLGNMSNIEIIDA
jgi:uncharacterized protein (DUF362 family)